MAVGSKLIQQTRGTVRRNEAGKEINDKLLSQNIGGGQLQNIKKPIRFSYLAFYFSLEFLQ